ncbi:N,N-dimethylformamidase beta subunit family domain-containing protein [Dactylosporangium sp. CA-092794]|uniref:N,N-dimethylformamidase beta subunit family domain-containing protein n=1 Tax=Dactylosporangium sp. CA-092794 TaxID=3239929 RepID=UPI003D906126
MVSAGYTDRVSYRPGDTVRLAVSTTAAGWTAELVRLQALAIPSAGVERRQERVAAVAPVAGAGIDQRTAPGSYVRVDDVPGAGAQGLVVALAAMPTRPGAEAQELLAHGCPENGSGWAIGLDAGGRFTLRVATGAGSAEVVAGPVPVAGCWYELTAVIGARAGDALALTVAAAGTFEANHVVRRPASPATARSTLPGAPVPAAGPLFWACAGIGPDGAPVRPYDGRIESPVLVADAAADAGDAAAGGSRARLARHPALLAHWDLAAAIGRGGIGDTGLVRDAGPRGLHGAAVHHPQRAVRSSGWTGDVTDFRFAPEQYAALHFHRDDMTDCGWRFQGEVVLPADLRSGVYALEVIDDDGGRDTVPVLVAPPAGTATAPLLLVLPTNSYLAYGNDHVGVDSPRTQVWSQMVPTLDDFELFRDARRELGYSLYETHADGSGVCYSSWRRPLLTMRERAYDHNAPVWQFTGDMQLVDWLDRTGRDVDVVTDHDLHAQGAGLLARYRAVLTGTHPEYPSLEILRAYEEYVADGGRLVCTGGNGMYWVTAYDPGDDQVVEVRRWGGTQAWLAEPGEYHLGFTGHQGGIWRFSGRAPQKTFGVGFVAAGNPGASAGYRRVSTDPAVAWVFAGLSGEDFGGYGVAGGAAGLEIDSASPPLGTSPDAVVLATSVGHGDDMLEARENFNMTSRVLGGARNPRVHADLVLVPRAGGGAVFSTGSIAFAGALGDRDGEVSVLLGNVLDRFVAGGPVLDTAPAGDTTPAGDTARAGDITPARDTSA